MTHEYPTAIELSLLGVSTMGIVVGGMWSNAVFFYQPSGPAFFSYQHDLALETDASPFIFMQFGSRGEMDRQNTISPETAWEGLREFFATAKQPVAIPWYGYGDEGLLRWQPDNEGSDACAAVRRGWLKSWLNALAAPLVRPGVVLLIMEGAKVVATAAVMSPAEPGDASKSGLTCCPAGTGRLRVVLDSSNDEMYYTWTHYGGSGAPAFARIR